MTHAVLRCFRPYFSVFFRVVVRGQNLFSDAKHVTPV